MWTLDSVEFSFPTYYNIVSIFLIFYLCLISTLKLSMLIVCTIFYFRRLLVCINILAMWALFNDLLSTRTGHECLVFLPPIWLWLIIIFFISKYFQISLSKFSQTNCECCYFAHVSLLGRCIFFFSMFTTNVLLAHNDITNWFIFVHFFIC